MTATTVSSISRDRGGTGCPNLVELAYLPPYGSGAEGVAPVEGSATFTGAGAATITGEISPIPAEFAGAGAGSLAATGHVTLTPTASFTGGGDLAANAPSASDIQATASFTGTGLADGTITIEVPVTADFTGGGTITVAIPTTEIHAQAGFGGEGGVGTVVAATDLREVSADNATMQPPPSSALATMR